MRVMVTFMGPLGQYVGQEDVHFDLPDGSTYATLLEAIGFRFGERFPSKIWDVEASAFGTGILVVGAGRDLDAPETPLVDNEEIKIIPIVGGG
jgi:molybdopterin converting factor small subunit